MDARFAHRKMIAALLLLASTCLTSGCVTFSHHAIPADRLPVELQACRKDCRTPINLALLGQDTPRTPTLVPGDTLGVYIKGVLLGNTDGTTPVLQQQSALQRDVYPPLGQINAPSVGFPMEIMPDGTLDLPTLGPVAIEGLTLQQAAEKIAKITIDKKLTEAGKEYVSLNLIKREVVRVVVVREDTQTDVPTLIRREQQPLAKRGFGNILDLPVHENDLLHALTATGGLPGIDACNEVWVLRQERVDPALSQRVWDSAADGGDPMPFLSDVQPFATATRIPLWTNGGANPCFSQQDVILRNGDIVYVKPRDDEFFYTGGLLPGAAVPLPRDRDIDILEAIAIANGSAGGPGGTSGVAVFRSGAGPGNIIPPTRGLIIRKLPNSQQIAIRVDLAKAMRDADHRVIIQPGDFISLNFRPGEVVANSALNFFNFTYILGN